MRIAAALILLAVGVAEAKTYSGHLYIGPESEAFYPCGNTTGYWFLASKASRDRLLADGLAKSVALSEQGVFVEFEGRVGRKTKEPDEAAYQYPAYFHIKRVISVRTIGPNDCQR